MVASGPAATLQRGWVDVRTPRPGTAVVSGPAVPPSANGGAAKVNVSKSSNRMTMNDDSMIETLAIIVIYTHMFYLSSMITSSVNPSIYLSVSSALIKCNHLMSQSGLAAIAMQP